MNQRLDYNSSFYSFKLLDELDYVIGGYGQATQEFIYSLNSFVENYILNENIFISNREFKHFFLTSKLVFPNGRPMMELLLTKNKPQFGILDYPIFVNGKILHVQHVSNRPTKMEESEIIQEFQFKNTEHIINNYSKPIFFEGFNPEYSFLASQTVDNPNHTKSYVIVETKITPEVLLNSVNDAIPNSNFQTALPLNALKDKIVHSKNQSISSNSMKILADLYDTNIAELTKFTGYNNLKIPPFVPILLSQCNTIDDIPNKLLQLREDFTELRKSFIDFEKQLEEAQSIKKQMEIIKYYNSFWESFHKKFNQKSSRLLYHFWDLGNKSELINASEDSLVTQTTADFLKDLNLGKLVGSALSKVYTWHKDRRVLNRFKGMTNIWELFQNAPTLENQVKDIERLFKIKVNPEHLANLASQLHK